MVIKHTRLALDRGEAAKAEWQKSFDAWAARQPGEQGAVRPVWPRGNCPTAGPTRCRPGRPDPKGVSTRAASGAVLTALAPVLPELWGGSADLAESNNTTMNGADSFGPAGGEDQPLERHALRPDPAFRDPRARHGRDPDRHRAARTDPAVRRNVPAVLRLHARRGPAGRGDGCAGDLRLDARLDRPRRGRPHPSAGRAPRRAARHPGPVASSGPPTRNETAYAWRAMLDKQSDVLRPGRAVPDPAGRPGPGGHAAPRAWPRAATSSPRPTATCR